MNCRKIEILLPEYAAGRLGHTEREKLERHLKTCAGCREELAGINEFFKLAATEVTEQVEVPEGYFDTVWPDLYSRIQDEKLNERKLSIIERLKELVPVRRLPGFQVVNFALISIVCIFLFIINTNEFDRGSPDAGLPQIAREQDAQGSPEEDARVEPAAGEQKIPDQLAGDSSGPEREPLEEWGQYLNPEKQREMYESLTDYLAEKIISLDETGLLSARPVNPKPGRAES